MLPDLSKEFSSDLNKLFDFCFGITPFSILEKAGNKSFVASSLGPKDSIVLSNERKVRGYFGFGLSMDREKRYLSVVKSDFHIFYGSAKSEPLFRYEYVKNPREAEWPNSHFQIHAERGEFTFLQQTTNKDQLEKISKAHFPVGGSLMRPSLEEIILFCDREFHMGMSVEKIEKLKESMEYFREKQALAIAREYKEVLKSAGWIYPTVKA